jgi:hypothetical protein
MVSPALTAIIAVANSPLLSFLQPKPGNASGWYHLVSGNALGKRNFTSTKSTTPAQSPPETKRSKLDVATTDPEPGELQSHANHHAASAATATSTAMATKPQSCSGTSTHVDNGTHDAPTSMSNALDAEPGELTQAQMEELMKPAQTTGPASNPATTVRVQPAASLATTAVADPQTALAAGHAPLVELVGRFTQRTVMSLLSNLINWMPADHVPRWQAQWQYAMLTCLDRDLMAAGAASSLRRLHRRLDHVLNNEVSENDEGVVVVGMEWRGGS